MWATVLATVAFVVVAAKAHGRQVRLEREQQGVFRVDFRRQNPSAVEIIWRQDRRTFWPAFAVFGLAGTGLVVGQPDPLPHLPLFLAWAFAEAFVVAGLASWVRMAGRREGPPPWRRRAQLGSFAWWGVVVAAAMLVALSA